MTVVAQAFDVPHRPFATVHDAKVGDEHSWSRTFSQVDTEQTGKATGDMNPIHFDAEYARKTRFRRPILHGVATLGEVSRALGMDFPGRGTIFVDLQCNFRAPIYPGETVHFCARIAEIVHKWNKLIISVKATIKDKVVFTALATVILGDDPLQAQ